MHAEAGMYALKVGAKTRALNFFRRIFTIPPLDSFLARLTSGKAADSFISKFAPPSYLFPLNSVRNVKRNGFFFRLNVHDMVDQHIFFGFRDISRTRLYDLARKGNIVFDIGANIGETALRLSRLIEPGGCVFAFEPDALNYSKADYNIKLNRVDNIRLVNVGLGTVNKSVKLYTVYDINRGMNRILDDDDVPFEYSEIQIMALDDFVSENAITQIDLIKIDVEGYEMEVLKGAIKSIGKYKPVIFAEIDDFYLQQHHSSASRLVQWLESFNYRIIHSETGEKITSENNFHNCHFDIIGLP